MTTAICPWAVGDDYVAYHDKEWGVANYDRNALFEKLCLEGQQAGLSWITVLRKREHYRKCFHKFAPEKIAKMSDETIEELLLDAGLIRNRLKLFGIRKNAQALLAMEAQGIDFAKFLWDFVDGRPIVRSPQSMQDIPTETAQSKAMSKALKKAGFTFVGSTICYAFMQSMGLVNDHLTSCHCHPKHQKV